MRTFRTVICAVLCLAMLVSFSSFASAKGGETASVSVTADKSVCAPGETVKVTVSVSTNYNAVAMRWFVLYSKSVFELVGADGGFAVSDAFEAIGGSTSSNMTGNVSYPSGYSSDDYGVALIQWLGGGENLAVFNHPQALDCFTFSLKVKDGASENATGSIFIPDNSSYYNAALEDANDASTYYKADGLVCTFSGSQVVVKNPVAPELLPTQGSDVVIDSEAKIIYGFTNGVDSAESYLDYVYAAGDGAYVEVASSAMGYGTGSVVKLMQNATVIEQYKVVYFGDATGDGVVDESDFLMIDLYNSMLYAPQETSPEYLGMDCTRDGVVDESDLVIVDLVNAFMGEINQVDGGINFFN